MKIMSVDLGDARTGLALCDRTEFLASPLGVIHDKSPTGTLTKVAAAAVEYGAQAIIVGYPRNMNGSVGERAKKCEQFAQRLAQLVKVPITLWDERSTTVSAHQVLNETNTRGKKRKDVVDEVAAVIILESYLAYRRNQSTFLSIDRIEGEIAVCLDDERHKHEFRAERLPEGAKEGDILRMDGQGKLSLDPAEADKRRRKAQELLDRLTDTE